MRAKYSLQVLVLLALLFSAVPRNVEAASPPPVPPVDMFQFPWEQGRAWIAMDGFDNGSKRLTNSPHFYKNGGAIDFAPHVGIHVGEDTSNYWVTAAAAGTVSEVSTCIVKIDHGDGWTTEYWHLDKIQVKQNETVEQNQKLAVIADNIHKQVCVGNEWPGPHVHFVLRPNMVGATFSGWLTGYNKFTNRTTFTKDGKTLGSYEPLLNVGAAQFVSREQLSAEAVHIGDVAQDRSERWPFQLDQETAVTFTATAAGSDLVPLLVLFDAIGNEVTRAVGSITTTLPAGRYSLQVQPQSGSGAYNLIMEQVQALPQGPSSSAGVDSRVIQPGESTPVTIKLNDVPGEGYTSTEFTCSCDPAQVEVSNIQDAGLFGADAVIVTNAPQNGTFIVAIAGSNGSRATSSGPAFTFTVKGLQAGQSEVTCQARVSKGDSTLTSIPAVSASLNIAGGTSAPRPASPAESAGAGAAPEEGAGTGSEAVSASLSGKVIATKPVTVSLYHADSSLAASVTADWDGAFSLTAVAGTYTVIAAADGYLSAQGTAALSAEGKTLATISLIAGDIDHNNVIDQYDAMTIGMSYNTSSPAAADLNNDGNINVLDLEMLAAHYRRSGALAWE